MTEGLVYLDDLARLLAKKTDEGKIKWEAGDPHGFITDIGNTHVGIFCEGASDHQLLRIHADPSTADPPATVRMAVVDRSGRPIQSCQIQLPDSNFDVFYDLWRAAAKSTRLGDSALKKLIEQVKELA